MTLKNLFKWLLGKSNPAGRSTVTKDRGNQRQPTEDISKWLPKEGAPIDHPATAGNPTGQQRPAEMVSERKSRSLRAIIGLDFGTAFTKVVIRVGGQVYGVPLDKSKQGVDKYLLPTRLYEDTDGNFNITQPDNYLSFHTDLKMRILDNNLDTATKWHITIYIAFVLKRARDWLVFEKQSVLSGARLKWEINVGLPTEKYNDKKLKKIYRALVKSAWDKSIYFPSGGKNPRNDNDAKQEISADLIEAFPEFVAQIQGYISSPQRKRGLHTLIDVGAGTVDTTVFIVHKDQGENKHAILAGSVKKLGTAYLEKHLYEKFGQLSNRSSESFYVFPSRIELSEKLGVKAEEIANAGRAFQKRVINEINAQLAYAKKHMTSGVQEEWQTGIPMMLCGGGAQVGLYQETAGILTAPGGYPLQTLHLPALSNLNAQHLLDEDYDRLSVAHGLSFDALQIGEIQHPEKIPTTNSDAKISKCPKCNGSGGLHHACPQCGGSGFC